MCDADENPTGARLAVDPTAIRGAIAEQEQGPWAQLTARDIDARIAAAVDDLAQAAGVEVRHVDWSCYGQGYASAVPVVVSRADEDERRASRRFEDFEGVVVALCRLAPLACISRPSRERVGEAGMLDQGYFIDAQHSTWVRAVADIDATLARHGTTRLHPEILNQRIDPNLQIDTNFGDPPFTVFDAWFHWWD